MLGFHYHPQGPGPCSQHSGGHSARPRADNSALLRSLGAARTTRADLHGLHQRRRL